ncbi:hypothetical protein MTO96_019165 [Rhipicephalus appendiculatus]
MGMEGGGQSSEMSLLLPLAAAAQAASGEPAAPWMSGCLRPDEGATKRAKTIKRKPGKRKTKEAGGTYDEQKQQQRRSCRHCFCLLPVAAVALLLGKETLARRGTKGPGTHPDARR